MSIFVDDTPFVIEVRYREIRNAHDQITGVKVLPSDEEGPDIFRLVGQALGDDSETMSEIIEEASVLNHLDKKPMTRSRIYTKLVLERFFVSLGVIDHNGDPVEPEAGSVGRLRHSLARALVREWKKATKG